jgi:hypothetical protein
MMQAELAAWFGALIAMNVTRVTCGQTELVVQPGCDQTLIWRLQFELSRACIMQSDAKKRKKLRLRCRVCVGISCTRAPMSTVCT